MKKFLFATSALAILCGATQAQAVVLPGHAGITAYNGPSTCVACHPVQAQDMLNSLHMKWSGPTPELTNAPTQNLGKAVKGINTFCTYAMSSGNTCFTCHIRADGNAPHAPSANDVDCLMCHSDTYQRKFTSDPTKTQTVTNILGQIKTYVFGLTDANGNYFIEPNYAAMPAGTTMVDIAKNVHKTTRKSCLRCHATAGGGDWTKRGDMGINTATPTDTQDVHMSPTRGNLTCSSCHAVSGHKVAGRGIDLRQTEAVDPKCSDCHGTAPHSASNSTTVKMNRHATNGRVACQICHIRTFAKGGATEMHRDFNNPVWLPSHLGGQGGFIGHEDKASNVKPEYRWFDGTSYVYNVGETIAKNGDGSITMAKANGKIFDGKSKIVPIKNHTTVMPLLSDGRIVPPMILWMFMTGDYNAAVQKGMQEQGMTGSYTMVNANAEMLITHGVEPKTMAPTCTECHNLKGNTPDGSKMIPFGKLGYHTWPAKVKNCTLCHGNRGLKWQNLHKKHAEELGKDCSACHTTEPTGWIEPPTKDGLCNNCHSGKTYNSAQDLHKEHAEVVHGGMKTTCKSCHTF
ncbi:MAG: hypothetical protein KKH22_11450 [Proteobacteria bacterium]|nr:hypothetical protein [Pseudomonadota bacterium]